MNTDTEKDQESGEEIKEYSTQDDTHSLPSHPNVASSSVVLHLQVSNSDVAPSEQSSYNYEREFLNYKPDLTLPWAYSEDDTFCVKPEEIPNSHPADKSSEMSDEVKNASIVSSPPNQVVDQPEEKKEYQEDIEDHSYVKKVTSVLRDFERKSDDGEWPMSTSVSCYWCSHQFDNPPIGLPMKYFASEDGFYVTGCFCSISCAAAFNLASRDSNDTVCERHSMLCSLSKMLTGDDSVTVAPTWKSLVKFGGYMTIQQFRGFSNDKVVLANVPPMCSMTIQLEEVNEGDVGSGYNYVPLDPVRVERGELSLRRKKPLHDYKNTLDHKMNVTINSAV